MINNGFLNGLVQSLFQKGKSSTSQIENQAKPDTKGRSLPTVKFDPKLVHNPEMAANIRNNVQTIKCIGWCIGSENTKEVEAAVTRAAASGRNIKMLTDELAACRTNDKETGHRQVLGLSFYVHFSSRKPYQAHSTPNKPQLAALYS